MSMPQNPPRAILSEDEEALVARAAAVVGEREEAGLSGLVGNLDSIIIGTETDHLVPAVYELLRCTGFDCTESFFKNYHQWYVLALPGSASVIVRSRIGDTNPFAEANRAQKTSALPNTRLETLIFTTPDIRSYVSIQNKRGVRFMTPEIREFDDFSFIQTRPSPFTGNSLGFIEWKGEKKTYAPSIARKVLPDIKKPAFPHLKNIGMIDHVATRIRAGDRTSAISEFLNLTNYHYDFGVHVKSQNSITSVARREKNDVAMVFTSGIRPYTTGTESGPTEMFIRNYGTRVHHVAFQTEKIEETIAMLQRDHMEFLLDLAGSEEEGLRQIFSEPSRHTLLVNEYIHRYGNFDGFFTKSNVEKLTAASGKQ